MTEARLYRIVVGFDYSSASELALKRAFELASREPDGEVHVVNVVVQLGDYMVPGMPDVAMTPLVPIGEAYEALEARAGQLMSAWQVETGKTFRRLVAHVRSELPAVEIAQLASDLEAELIVIGTHGRRGLSRFLLGSVAEGVVRAAHCPVLVMRPVDRVRVPEIEPPCADCLQVRAESAGKTLWCSEHAARHGQRHTYHYESRVATPSNPPLVIR